MIKSYTEIMRIILSRTDSIGDVVLTLPMTGVLKEAFPACTIIFLGRSYTRPVIKACRFVDQFVDLDEISKPGMLVRALAELKADVIIHVFPVKEICKAARAALIPQRIATSHKLFTWFTCNRLLHFSRKNSNLHEVQLNLKLLGLLRITRDFDLAQIPQYYGLKGQFPMVQEADSKHKFRLILHPKSKGSAREWGLENFGKLIDILPPEKFSITITGTREEGELMHDFLLSYKGRINDMTGRLSLSELLELIASSDGLVAASTGPLHLAAAFGIAAVGLYAPMRPIFPQRWAPLGEKACFLVLDTNCSDCRHSGDCHCIRSITPEMVLEKLTKGIK
jgi:ADP-heptose:LPS heptosyltransferase